MAIAIEGEEVQACPDFERSDEDVKKLEIDHINSIPSIEKETVEEIIDPFGNEETADVKYKVLTWWQCGLLMIAETMSLGILALPSAVAMLGLVPAIFVLISVGLLTTYTGYTIGQFKVAYPNVHSMADAGEILMGRFGREFLGAGQLLFLIFIMGSHLLTFVVLMDTLSNNRTCSIIFGVMGMLISLILTLPRTLQKVSWLSIISFSSIISAVMITIVALGVQRVGTGIDLFVKTTFARGFLAASNIVFAYSGHVAFFGFASELQNPRDYTKSLLTLQTTNTTVYTIAAVVIYCFAGRDVASPALGSTGPVVSKIAYGIAFPTIVIAGVINGHVACKYVYVRLFRGTDLMSQRSFASIGAWVGIAVFLWLMAWIIAESIPGFNNLLSLITALFASWFTLAINGWFGLHLDKGRYFSSPRKIMVACLNIFCIGSGIFVCIFGLYVSGKFISEETAIHGSFTCASKT
ncbi:neutral amino acid permease [Histoplasma ohiense]|nr:neutral amino acid permease [Histoplasma ohiense (nom. inval.)]